MRPILVARHAGFFHDHVDREHAEPDPRQDDDGQPVPDHQREAAVDHDLAQVIGVADVAVQAIRDQAALQAECVVLLRVGHHHDHGPDDAEADAQAKPRIVGQRVVRLRHARYQQPAEYPVPAEYADEGIDPAADRDASLPARVRERDAARQCSPAVRG